MSPTRGYYSLIQFCPDPGRLEFANVGVLLFCPEIGFIDTLLARDNDRVRRFFDKEYPLDLARLKTAKQSLADRIKAACDSFQEIKDLERFIDTRANELRLSQLRSMKVIDPEAALKDLFIELVGERHGQAEHKLVFPELEQIFQQLNTRLPNRVYTKRQMVDVPALGRAIEVNYGYHNGSLNWIRTQRFQGKNPQINDVAFRLAMEGRFIEKHPTEQGEHQKLIVVSSIPPDCVRDVQPRLKEIFGEVGQRLVTQDEVESFSKEILEEAH